VPEVVADGETGFLVPAHDENAMADRIVALLRDPSLRQRMGEAGLARARRLFTVERMVSETARVYERLAGKSRAAGTANPAAGD
jgi:glycosyltransferase involved in cell wall biosynthesis